MNKSFYLYEKALIIIFVAMIVFSNLTDWQIFGSLSGFYIFLILFVVFAALTLIDFRRFYGILERKYIFTPLLLFFFWWFFRSILSMIKPPFYNTELWQWIILFIIFTNYISKDSRIGYQALLGYLMSAVVILILFYSGSNVSYVSGRLTVFELTNPNTLGNITSNALLITILLVTRDLLSWGKMRFLLILFFPLLFDILIKTGSRGALICFIVGIVLILALSRIKLSWKIFGGVVFLIFCIVAIYFLISSDIFKSRWIEDDLSRLGGRNAIWVVSFNLFLERPLIGYGDGGLQDAIWIYFTSYKEPHNLYLVLLVTSGIVGFTLFMLFFYRIFRLSLDNYRINDNIVCLVLFTVNIIAFFKQGSALNSLITWLILAIIVGLGYAIKNENEEKDVLIDGRPI